MWNDEACAKNLTQAMAGGRSVPHAGKPGKGEDAYEGTPFFGEGVSAVRMCVEMGAHPARVSRRDCFTAGSSTVNVVPLPS